MFHYNSNFNDLPSWQKRGIGVYWHEVEKTGFNPVLEQPVTVKRRTLHTEYELPMKDNYNDFVLQRIP
ncbi:hypothetical protein [Chitinophaga sp. HK235]|uniref:hypothetical protein n=1 Tax=Chitinophaga sp. HK235 TaxID=2952571 RepID=UPI002012C701|nr:hypothetical protein [Chitinophaga sp. HK235]